MIEPADIDAAIEALGGVVSQAGGQGDAALDVFKDIAGEVLRQRVELARVEAVLVAADRVREAYEAMIEGRDIGRLAMWERE